MLLGREGEGGGAVDGGGAGRVKRGPHGGGRRLRNFPRQADGIACEWSSFTSVTPTSWVMPHAEWYQLTGFDMTAKSLSVRKERKSCKVKYNRNNGTDTWTSSANVMVGTWQ